MAPEVIEGTYEGDEADVWSCAVVLFVLLLGCHPWEEPSFRCEHYVTFCKSKYHNYAPWNRLDPLVKGVWITWYYLMLVDLLLSIMKVDPKGRLKMDQIKSHPWVTQSNALLDSEGQCSSPSILMSLIASKHHSATVIPTIDASPSLSHTQPEIVGPSSQGPINRSFYCFSQPNNELEALSSTTTATSWSSIPGHRLTRFCSRKSVSLIVGRLREVLQSMLVPSKSSSESNVVTCLTKNYV